MAIRSSFKDTLRATRARWQKRFGIGNALMSNYDNIDYAADNNWPEKASSADGTRDIEVWRVDTDNALQIGREAIQPMMFAMNLDVVAPSGTPTQAFFVAPRALTITQIQVSFGVANGAALTGTITHETGTQAPGAGNVVQVGSFNLNSTANVVQTATLPTPYATQSTGVPQPGVLSLAAGDRLSFKFSTAVTSLAGLIVTVHAAPGAKGHCAVFHVAANGSLTQNAYFHLANRPQTVQAVQIIYSAAATTAGAVTIDLTKESSTTASGSGTTLLSAPLNVKLTPNTVYAATLTATAADLNLAAGDRLSAHFSTATLTSLAGMIIVVWFTPVIGRKEVTYSMAPNGSLATESFYIADKDYEIIDLSEAHGTAGTDGGAVTLAVTVDGPGVAPGAGWVVQTDNTNAGFNLKGTADTVQIGTLATPRNRVLPSGSKLSVKYAGTLTALANVVVTVSLRPM